MVLYGLLFITQKTCAYDSVLISNDAKVWPPTLLGYTSKVKDVCPTELKDYGILGVGQNTTIPYSKHICAMYSPIGLMWSIPQLCTPNTSIALQAKIVDGQLEYRLIID